MKTRGPIADGTVQLQQLGDKGSQFLNQKLRRVGFSNKAWYVVALGNPYASFAVPLRPDLIDTG
jgi:hypothetical protein